MWVSRPEGIDKYSYCYLSDIEILEDALYRGHTSGMQRRYDNVHVQVKLINS